MSGRVLPFDPAAHKVADVLLPWFVNGTLDKDELAFVQQHLSECARCQREVQWLRELRAACVDGESAPGGSTVFRNLRRQLDEPRAGPGKGASLRRLWKRAPPWSRWAIAAQLAVIVGLGAALVPATDGPTLYRTLGARNAPAAATGSLVVVFDPTTTESDLRRILRKAGARVADGPTQTNAYVLKVEAERRTEAMRALRAEPAVVLVEQLDPGEAR
ncbi:MAG TPA: zf-HC2 domain-containing protein [Casimicrobiaceae bacterium]|nr:zf-HC2 domain-containing protein [Casimicrobiaceae bacterium]